MPFYDGIGVIAEKHAVVLDIGTVLCKVGYAGEPIPRAIIRTPECLKITSTSKLTSDEEYEHFRDKVVSFVHKLYFEYLLVNPKDRRVVLVESLLGDLRLRDMVVGVLFGHFEVLSVLLAPSHIMPLFGLGITSALVVDVGYEEATLIPIYQNVPVLKAWQAQPLASKAIHKSLKEDIMTRGTASRGERGNYEKASEIGIDLSEEIIEDIKIRLCFVTDISRGHQIQQIRNDASSVSGLSSFLKKSVPPATYPLNGDIILRIDGQTRESACEMLFEQDNDRMSVSTMVLDALLACPIDTRIELAENIVVVGGTSMIKGFKARLFQELKHLLKKEPYCSRLHVGDFKLHQAPGKANFSCWSGASIFGATDAIGTRSFTRENYFKDRSVPDWSNLKYNSLYNTERNG
jgi:actin-related protein 10